MAPDRLRAAIDDETRHRIHVTRSIQRADGEQIDVARQNAGKRAPGDVTEQGALVVVNHRSASRKQGLSTWAEVLLLRPAIDLRFSWMRNPG